LVLIWCKFTLALSITALTWSRIVSNRWKA